MRSRTRGFQEKLLNSEFLDWKLFKSETHKRLKTIKQLLNHSEF